MSALYWIDDSSHDMNLIMENVFPVLWNIDCACRTILFGNDYCNRETEKGPGEDDRKAFDTNLREFFAVYCQEIDKNEWEEIGKTYESKKHLVSDPTVILIPLEDDTEDLAKNWLNCELLGNVKDHPAYLSGTPIHSDYTEPEDQTVVGDKAGSLSVDQLIADMGIPDDAVVALDICLLYHDIDRIGNGLPSISMALYDRLRKNKHRCYLYSSRTIARTVMDQWIKTFQDLFGASGDITIHPKVGLLAAAPNTPEKNALVRLLNGKD